MKILRVNLQREETVRKEKAPKQMYYIISCLKLIILMLGYRRTYFVDAEYDWA